MVGKNKLNGGKALQFYPLQKSNDCQAIWWPISKNLHFGYEGHLHLKKYDIILTYRVYEKE